MKKLLSLLTMVLVVTLLSSCDALVTGWTCYVDIDSYAENEEYFFCGGNL